MLNRPPEARKQRAGMGPLPKGAVGPYQLQAAIAAVHDEASRVDDTDWRQIAALYGVLMRISDSPMVTLIMRSPRRWSRVRWRDWRFWTPSKQTER